MTQPITERKQSLKPGLRFTPYAWAKLLFMCHTRDTEVSGMGIGAESDPMTVEDILIIKQRSSSAFTRFDPEDYANRMVELCDPEGKFRLSIQRCARIWIHTHPAGVGRPSMTDDQTFDEAFGIADWAVMFIYSKSEDVYCQLRMTARNASGLATELRQEIPVDIAWELPFPAADPVGWKAELDERVGPDTVLFAPPEPLSAIGVMPAVRMGVVHAPPPVPLSRPSLPAPGGGAPVDQRPSKAKLVPVAGSLLDGLSSQHLTRLLNSDISKEALFTGGIIQKMEKNGWELVEIDQAVTPYADNIPLQISTVHFRHKNLPGKIFGNRDLALADRDVLTAGQSVENVAALSTAEFDLQAVAEDRVLGEPGQRDSFGYSLGAVFPWHVPGRAVLFISINELEELLLVVEGIDPLVQTNTQLDDVPSLSTYITGSWEKLKAMGVSTHDACREILKGVNLLNPSLASQGQQDVLRQWIARTVMGIPRDQEDTQEIEVQVEVPPPQSEDLEQAKGLFREVLTKARNDGCSVSEIDIEFTKLYDKALQGKWIDEFIMVLQHVRANGYDVTCLDRPIDITQKTLELLEGGGA